MNFCDDSEVLSLFLVLRAQLRNKAKLKYILNDKKKKDRINLITAKIEKKKFTEN